MKRCDLHIHTVASVSDRAFVYDKEVLKDYVEKTGLDVIAITNHNLFDYGQFNYGSITDTLPSKDQSYYVCNMKSYHRALNVCWRRFRFANADEPLRYAPRTLTVIKTMKGAALRDVKN